MVTKVDPRTLERLQDDEYRKEFGAELAKLAIAWAFVEARKGNNLTQAALADLTGVSQAYIAKLESGEANPTIGRVGALLGAIWSKPVIEVQPLVKWNRSAPHRQRHGTQPSAYEDKVIDRAVGSDEEAPYNLMSFTGRTKSTTTSGGYASESA